MRAALSDLKLDSYSYTVNTTAFTNSVTDLAGWYVNSWSGDNYGYVDNFQVFDAIPEPSTVILLALGGVVAWARRRTKG